jgi:hypothetical protein
LAMLFASKSSDCMLERIALAAKILIWSIEAQCELQVASQNRPVTKIFYFALTFAISEKAAPSLFVEPKSMSASSRRSSKSNSLKIG